MQSQQPYYQGQPQMNPNMQQPTAPRKRINIVAMIGLGLILSTFQHFREIWQIINFDHIPIKSFNY